MRRKNLLLSLSALAALLAAPALIGCGGSSLDVQPTDDAGDDASDAPKDGPDDDNPVCGNGFKEGPELCDEGANNGGPSAACQTDCTWTCLNVPGNTQCDDKNPCNGVESCSDAHTCQNGTPVAENGACGTGMICRSNLCVDASCGDAVVTAPEECDDGNTTTGDGCEPSCKFTCVAGDATRACPATDACAGTSTCSATHTCAPGTPLGDGTACGTGQLCKAGVCSAASCGDGFVSAGEDCDFGGGNGAGTGCEATCKFSCATDAACADANVCNGAETCAAVTVGAATGKRCKAGTNAPNTTSCPGGKCDGAGVCKASATCGNGAIDAGEQCDLGAANNGTAKGCTAACQFECSITPTDSCAAADTNSCDGANKCTSFTGLGGTGTGQRCVNGAAPAKCSACTGGVCVSNACAAAKCGDGCVSGAEQCEPPGSATCSATCMNVVVAACGNGKREAGEQCDDGNKTNTDGCDSTCQFEQTHRINALALDYGTSFCANNKLGLAVTNGTARDRLNGSLSDSVTDGSISILFDFLYPTLPHDLTGTNVNPLTVGSLTGKPVAAPSGATYNGLSDLDWWYTAAPASIDPTTRLPTGTLSGTIASKKLSIPTGNLTIMVDLGGGALPLSLSAVKLTGTVGGVNAPKISSGSTPGHQASENLDPALQSFQSITGGQLCGNVSAYSLSKAPIPSTLATGGSLACNENYATTATLLDLFVGGCTKTIILPITILKPIQPDQTDPTAPAWAAGPAYTLTRTGKSVTGCQDKNKKATTNATEFDQCLRAAAFSSAFTFTTDRVIVK